MCQVSRSAFLSPKGILPTSILCLPLVKLAKTFQPWSSMSPFEIEAVGPFAPFIISLPARVKLAGGFGQEEECRFRSTLEQYAYEIARI